MSTPEINQVLAQMRVVTAQASGGIAVNETPQNEFGDLLKRSIDSVNETQQNASSLRTAFEQGDYERRLVEHYYPYSLGEGQTDVTRV